ncbi:MAG TPA: NAD-binding protein [Propionicimonas sp.]|nr:NAD-binding protein [Propionicimonas sp.]HRA06939.1 NAD-binding protein [Propionicimonas sp.]
MDKATLGEKIRYWFDNWMARGTIALMGLLGLATLVLVFVVSLVVWVFRAFPDDAAEGDFIDLLWGGLMRTLDPGTMGGDSGWGFRLLMLVITIGGLIIVASLIGIVSGAFDSKVEDLRKGRSRVLESDHTLILGWNPKIHSIVHEIAVANESRGRASIVVLADRDKVEMEDEIRAEAGDLGKTTVICRTGDPKSLTDLAIVSPGAARSIILLAPQGSPDPDAEVLKTALALTNNPARKPEPHHIVGELSSAESLEVARLVGKDEAHWVLSPDLIGRITVQSCRQSGLSVVYGELLDFDGDEIYFTEQPSLVGRTYFDAQLAFPKCVAMGLEKGGDVILNPSPETVIEASDRIIVIAEDDSLIALGEPGVADTASLAHAVPVSLAPESTLVLGTNAGLAGMLGELSEYVASGSTVRVVSASEPELPQFENLSAVWTQGDPTKRAVLEALDVSGFDHIIVLADKDDPDLQRADSRTLVTLLQLRDLSEAGGFELNVVSEMLDDTNRELAEVTRADDLIVSDRLIALLLSQISESRELTDVFDTLFSSAGSEIYLNPAEDYIVPGQQVDFYAVLEAARRRGETAIGYRVAADAHVSANGYGVRVNPLKSERISFASGDRVIVLAEGKD